MRRNGATTNSIKRRDPKVKRKTIILPTMLLLLFTMSISVASALDFSVTDTTQSVAQGEALNTQITITNNEEMANYTITLNDLTGSAGTITAASLSISPETNDNVGNGDAFQISLTGTIDTNQAAGTYTGTIDVTADNGSNTLAKSAAVTVTVSESIKGTITYQAITLGDENQEREETISKSVIISNQGVEDVTSVSVSTNDVGSEYALNTTLSSTIIPAGGEIQLTIEAYVPDDQDAGVKKIGTITVTGNQGGNTLTQTEDLNLEVENKLEIKRVTVTYDGDDDRVDDGDKVNVDEEIRPGSEIQIEVEVENTFKDNIDIEDVEITIDADNNDLDWDETEDVGDIKDGDEESYTFTLNIDRDADEDTYDVTVIVTGIDENGARHEEQMTFEIEVEKKREDLLIDRLDLSKSYLACGERTTTIELRIENVGSRDVDRGTILIENDMLGIEEIIRDIEIDEGDDERFTETITVPRNADAGSYYLDVYVYTSANEEDQTDIESIQLTVEGCPVDNGGNDEEDNGEDNSGDDEKDNIDVVTPPTTSTPTGNVVSTVTGKPAEKGLLEGNNLTVTLLVAVIALLIVLIILAIASLTSSGKKKN